MKDSSSIIVNVSRVWFHNPVWIVNPIFAFLGYLKKKYFYPVPTLCNIYNQYKILLHIFLARYCQDLWIIAPYIQLSPTFHLRFLSWAVNLHYVKKVFFLCGVSFEIIHQPACLWFTVTDSTGLSVLKTRHTTVEKWAFPAYLHMVIVIMIFYIDSRTFCINLNTLCFI